MKIIWKVGEAPTGSYRSFQRRAWPTGEYEDGRIGFQILCEDDYIPARVKTGDHAELSLGFMDWTGPTPTWRRLKRRFATLAEAKSAAAELAIRTNGGLNEL